MKLDDIKSAVVHQCEMNLKRSIYDLVVFCHRGHIEGFVRATLNEVYDAVEPFDDSPGETRTEDIPF